MTDVTKLPEPRMVLARLNTDKGEEFEVIVGEPHTTKSNSYWAQFSQYGKQLPFAGMLQPFRVELKSTYMEDETSVYMVINGTVIAGDQLIYGFMTFDPLAAIDRLRLAFEFFTNWNVIQRWSVESINVHLIDRKVYYREMPAIVKQFNGAGGYVLLIPDITAEFFDEARWRHEPWTTHAASTGDVVRRVDMLDRQIYWHRE